MKKLAILLCGTLLLQADLTPLRAQAEGAEYRGAAGLGLELRRLGNTARVLMIGAHPDDESTQILSALALGRGVDVAYLSLTRGEGGQNGIGPELQEGLGLIRTEELLAARSLDGARQFFTRAYDFGFSKDADEAFRHWPRELILGDVVAVIRHFKPDVVISVFSGTPADGHGQHQAAGLLAREAFHAAGDPSRFPEHETRGLLPYAPRKLYHAPWRGDPAAEVRVSTGELDPLLGQSHFQVAMASRSLHRSQDMGQVLALGPRASQLRLTAVNGAPVDSSASIFAGIDTTMVDRLRRAGAPAAPSRASALLAEYEDHLARAARDFNPLFPQRLIPDLARAGRLLDEAESGLGAGEAPGVRFHFEAERRQLRSALWRASGLVLDVLSAEETVVPGDEVELTVTLWNGGRAPADVRMLEPLLPEGWTAHAADPLPAILAPGELATRRFRSTVPADADVTRPYFLRRPRDGDLYAWPAGVVVGLPFEGAPVRARAEVAVQGYVASSERDATFRSLDPRQGELRRPLRVVPPVTITLAPRVAVLPLAQAGADGPLRFSVRLRAESPRAVAGTLRIAPPAGWAVEPTEVPLAFEASGEERVVEVVATPPARVGSGMVRLEARFETRQGTTIDEGLMLLDYPHIRPRPLYVPAAACLSAFEVRLPEGLHVGYVAGAGDDADAALQQLGARVTAIAAEELAAGDLDRFDAIVTGIRAYEVRPELSAHNSRLLEYVRRGGTLVVQYNKYEFTRPGIAPYPVEMTRPHGRVTDEAADVRLLAPDHPALSWPNRIGAADFEGWVQERGLYFLSRWDDRFTPLLEMADPGEPPQRGALLVAPVGEGTYVYTGLALFRQLPEGIPGAYRLLANLVSLGAKP